MNSCKRLGLFVSLLLLLCLATTDIIWADSAVVDMRIVSKTTNPNGNVCFTISGSSGVTGAAPADINASACGSTCTWTGALSAAAADPSIYYGPYYATRVTSYDGQESSSFISAVGAGNFSSTYCISDEQTHTLRIYIRDITAYQCACTFYYVWGFDYNGSIIADQTLTFNKNTEVPTAADKPENDMGSSEALTCSNAGQGFPVWTVNKVNLNLYVTDTPLWYKAPFGPPVDIKLSYNSQAAIDANSVFGNKWTFNYGSYLIVDANGSVKVSMPDGRQDVYTLSGGVYTKPFGVFNTLTKISDNHYTLKFLNGTVYTYNIPAGSGLTRPTLVAITDAYGQSLTLAYTSGNLTTVTDALGRSSTFQYYANGLTQTVTDPFNRSISFEYDTAGNLTKTTDMGGYNTYYTYALNTEEQSYYLSEIKSPKVEEPQSDDDYRIWLFNIEPSDSATSPADYPDPAAATPKMGKLYRITITYPNNDKEEYFYNGYTTYYVSPRDYVTYVSSTSNNLVKAAKTVYTFDRSNSQKGLISQVATPSSVRATYTYDSSTGNPATITDNKSHSLKYEYNSNGLITRYWDAKTATTSDPNILYGYYSNDIDLHTVTYGSGAGSLGSIIYEYNSAHDIAAITDLMSVRTEFVYNGYGQLTSITEAKGIQDKEVVTELEYDSQTNTVKNIKKAGVVVASLTHDNIGRVQSVTYPDGVHITYEYDNLDQTKTITYPDGKTETIRNSSFCPYLVDSSTDRAGRITNYQYDALKRLTSLDGPDGRFKYGYDANSNLTTFTDADNKVTTFAYNLDNKIAKKTYADTKYVSYFYDSAGLLNNYINARGQASTYGYDENNNLTSIAYVSGATNVGFTYDQYNRLITRTDAIGTFTYTYYANGRPWTVKYPWDTGNTITYVYNALNQLESMNPAVGAAVNYTYDTMGRLKTIKRPSDATPFTYDYDTSMPASPLPVTLTRPNNSFTQYEYNDPLKKLTKLTNRNSSGTLINSYAYTYTNPRHPDLRNSETITNGTVIDSFTAGATTYSYGTNLVNQLQSSTNPARTYTYDNDGNMTRSYTTDGYAITLAYDAENRMTSAQYTDTANPPKTYKTEYLYTGDGLIAVEKKYEGTTTPLTLVKTTRLIRAGFLPIQERDADNNVTREYLWGLNYGGGIGGLLNLKQGGTDYNYLYDGKGNVTALIDSTQSPVVTYAYDPFGVLMKKVGTFDQPYQFSTKMYDSQLGHVKYEFRTYDPKIAKWMTRDPLGEEGGINLYGFVGGNPANYFDPHGLAAATPVPAGPIPIFPLPPVFIPGTSENQQFVRDTLSIWNSLSSSVRDSIQASKERQQEYEAAKRVCDTPPPPGNNDCSTLSRQIDHAERVIKLYEAWDMKWYPGRHDRKVQQWKNRLQNLKEEHHRRCTNK
jgi:RHS repeat-associated protein